MRAVLLVLKTFRKILHFKIVCVARDISTVVVYLERQEDQGLKSLVSSLSVYFFSIRKCSLLFQLSIFMQVECSGGYSLQTPPSSSDSMTAIYPSIFAGVWDRPHIGFFLQRPWKTVANLFLVDDRPNLNWEGRHAYKCIHAPRTSNFTRGSYLRRPRSDMLFLGRVSLHLLSTSHTGRYMIGAWTERSIWSWPLSRWLWILFSFCWGNAILPMLLLQAIAQQLPVYWLFMVDRR